MRIIEGQYLREGHVAQLRVWHKLMEITRKVVNEEARKVERRRRQEGTPHDEATSPQTGAST